MSETGAEPGVELGARQTPEPAVEACCSVVELRQYALKPSRGDEFIALFEEHLIEGQERYGMRIIGQFRNRSDPDQLVWLRGFPTMEARRVALEGFYSGPIWHEHRLAANDMIVDVDNVLLLTPAHAASSFHVDLAGRPAMDAPETAGGIVIAVVHAFAAPVAAQFLDFFETDVQPALRRVGATLIGQFVTEPSENTFPELPVREGEQVFVWLASFAGEAAYAAYQGALTVSREGITSLASLLQGSPAQLEEVLELIPARRSLLRHRA